MVTWILVKILWFICGQKINVESFHWKGGNYNSGIHSGRNASKYKFLNIFLMVVVYMIRWSDSILNSHVDEFFQRALNGYELVYYFRETAEFFLKLLSVEFLRGIKKVVFNVRCIHSSREGKQGTELKKLAVNIFYTSPILDAAITWLCGIWRK